LDQIQNLLLPCSEFGTFKHSDSFGVRWNRL
jgi:hypothetical protein